MQYWKILKPGGDPDFQDIRNTVLYYSFMDMRMKIMKIFNI